MVRVTLMVFSSLAVLLFRGLAPLICVKIIDVLRELNREGMTILLVEQKARMALKPAHRAYVLETG